MGEAGPGGTVRLEVCRRKIPLQPECVYMDQQALTANQLVTFIESSTGPIFFCKSQYSAKKRYFFGLYLHKTNICSDKMMTRIFEES